jgi:hypothetical protein
MLLLHWLVMNVHQAQMSLVIRGLSRGRSNYAAPSLQPYSTGPAAALIRRKFESAASLLTTGMKCTLPPASS